MKNRSDSPPGLPSLKQLLTIPQPPPDTDQPRSPTKHTHKRVLRKKLSQKHFSLPSESLLRLKLASRTDSMGSLGSGGSPDIPPTSFIHSMEMLREMISNANKSGNHYNISVDELRMLQSSLIEARRHDDTAMIREAEEELHNHLPGTSFSNSSCHSSRTH